jgi:hypothetical protein
MEGHTDPQNLTEALWKCEYDMYLSYECWKDLATENQIEVRLAYEVVMRIDLAIDTWTKASIDSISSKMVLINHSGRLGPSIVDP